MRETSFHPTLRSLRRAIYLSALILCALVLCALVTGPVNLSFAEDLSLIPLYGDGEKTKSEEEIRADDQFRRDAVKSAGSADRAASVLIAKGFESVAANDLDTAMRRFNQAWLLKPNRADVYWGLAAVESSRGNDVSSLKLFEEARNIDPKNPELLSDYAFGHMRFASHAAKTPEEGKQHLLTAAQLLHDAKAINPKFELAYTNSALLFAELNRPQEAWEQVFAAEALGGKSLNPRFLNDLNKSLPRRAAQQRAALNNPATAADSRGKVKIVAHGAK